MVYSKRTFLRPYRTNYENCHCPVQIISGKQSTGTNNVTQTSSQRISTLANSSHGGRIQFGDTFTQIAAVNVGPRNKF